MHLVSFNVFRTLGFPDTTFLKPEHFLRHKPLLQEADWVVFPEYWQLSALVHGLKCLIYGYICAFVVIRKKPDDRDIHG